MEELITILLHRLVLFLLFNCAIAAKQDSVFLNLKIKWPSGIQVDKMEDRNGKVFRFGRLLHNAITLRPEWKGINIIESVFSDEECLTIIQKAEDYAAKYGWSRGRHIDYDVRPTKDLPVTVIYENPEELQVVFDRFESVIWPRLGAEYGLDVSKLRPDDLFITKYNASSPEKGLAAHKDKSPWSFVISLNDDYQGGGSYFVDSDTQVRPPQGAAVYFSGNQLHGGSPITSGVRYILAGFIEYGDGSHQSFLDQYQPLYDGYAAHAGFRTGDLIVGLEVCEAVSEESEEEEGCVGASGQSVSEDGEVNTVECSGGYIRRNAVTGKKVLRTLSAVTGDTSDEEWVRMAQSCEIEDVGADTVIRVRRRV